MNNLSTNIFKSHHPKIERVLFALNHFRNQLLTSYSNNSFQFKYILETNYFNKNKYSMPSKKRITRVRFTAASRTANQPYTPPPRSANQRSNSPNDTLAASSTQIIPPTSPTLSSNVSTPPTPSPQIPTLNHIVIKIVSKSLIASLTSKDAVLKEVRDCIHTNNENRLKALNPYTHS